VVAETDEGEMLVTKRSFGAKRGAKDKHRQNIFQDRCHVQGKLCSLIIDNESYSNVSSTA